MYVYVPTNKDGTQNPNASQIQSSSKVVQYRQVPSNNRQISQSQIIQGQGQQRTQIINSGTRIIQSQHSYSQPRQVIRQQMGTNQDGKYNFQHIQYVKNCSRTTREISLDQSLLFAGKLLSIQRQLDLLISINF